jgi:type II secretory pathway pseudopilin PulG
MVVLVIIAILAAIAVPSLMRYIESGRQTNRMNIARTLYLAAQNQLTRLRVSGGLNPNADWEGFGFVYELDGAIALPDPPEDNPENVRFISNRSADPEEAALVRRILDPVIVDKNLLNEVSFCLFFTAKGRNMKTVLI